TETGLTLFDFSWDKRGKFNVHRVIKKLDRKVIINLLRGDLELILIPKSYSEKAKRSAGGAYIVSRKKEQVFFTVSQPCTAVEKAEVRHKEKLKTRVVFFPPAQNTPDSVYIEHFNFNMQLTLGRINRGHVSE
ncbi:MAG TPA: hypothetical protein VFM90_05305, partial [Cyclobacteriaceae bacterium]|nr:hypothetical protein [Cyclobacteriaceae bacterium]